MFQKESCEAGVEFASLEGHGTKEFHDTCPCFGPDYQGSCEHKTYPTNEEMDAEDDDIKRRFENITKARGAIVIHCGGPWKKGDHGKEGQIDCPVCRNDETLRFTRSGYNGHIHARCSTDDCVAWME